MPLNALRPGTSSLTTALSSLTLTSTRKFSTTQPFLTKTIPLPRIPDLNVPPYPYGERLLYKQSNNGLYGSARIRYGNNVSEKHNQITPRTWRPNVHRRKLWSDCLGAWVRTRLTTRVLRTIRKEGGLDNYVTKHKAARVKDLGPGGWKLRWLVMQTLNYQVKMIAEREKLGVTTPLPADNTLLAPVMVRAAIRGQKPSLADDELMHDMAARVLEQTLKHDAEGIALGQEAAEGFLADEAYEKFHIEGQKANTEKTV